MNKILTIKKLKEMKPGIFAQGITIDNPDGCNMSNSGKQLRWVAVRGDIHDWAIYCHYSDKDWEWIKRSGDKVCSKENIRKLVPCSKLAFEMYRY